MLKQSSPPQTQLGQAVSSIEHIGKDSLHKVLTDPENQWKLFPERRIVISWEPFKILPSNIEIIGNLCHEIIGTPDKTDSSRFTTISFGHYYETKVGLRYDIEIYGSDLQEVLDHAHKHVQLSYKYHTYGKHCVWFYLPIHIDEKIIQKEIEDKYNLEGEIDYIPMSLFDCDFPPKPKM